LDNFAPASADAAEVADRQTQAAPLGLAGDTAKKKKKQNPNATTGEKTRMQDRPKQPSDTTPPEITPAAPIQGAPAPKPAQQSAPAPQPAPASTPDSNPQPNPQP